MFEDRMKTSAIPERVFALCQMLDSKGAVENDVKEKLEPSEFGGSTSYFGAVRDAAKQLGLISTRDGNKIALAVGRKEIATMAEMRRYVVAHIENIQSGLFYAVSQAYMKLNEEIYKYKSASDAELIKQISIMTGKQIIEDDMRAWRFWSSFLGFGHLHRLSKGNNAAELLVPNAMVYLGAVLDVAALEKNREYTFENFMEETEVYTDILQKKTDKNLNMAFSYGLRGLHDLGRIKLVHKMDSENMWYLYKDEMHEIAGTVSHITILK